jgi:hypothetical protein
MGGDGQRQPRHGKTGLGHQGSLCHARQRCRFDPARGRRIEQGPGAVVGGDALGWADQRHRGIVLPALEAIKRRKGSKTEEARAASTDADASVRKMAEGVYGPVCNAQQARDCASLVVVGVKDRGLCVGARSTVEEGRAA